MSLMETEIPVHAEIETDEHNVGHCSGGFSLEYKPEIYDVKDWFGKIVARFVIGEDMAIKTGIISWSLAKLALLSTAVLQRIKKRRHERSYLVVTKDLKTVLVRFVTH